MNDAANISIEIEVYWQGRIQRYPVELLYVRNVWFVHLAPKTSSIYHLTHLPSGKAAASFRSKYQAVRACNGFAEILPNYEHNPDNLKTPPELNAKVKRLFRDTAARPPRMPKYEV